MEILVPVGAVALLVEVAEEFLLTFLVGMMTPKSLFMVRLITFDMLSVFMAVKCLI